MAEHKTLLIGASGIILSNDGQTNNCLCGIIPMSYREEFLQFLLDKRHGNFIFNCNHGKVLSGKVEIFLK